MVEEKDLLLDEIIPVEKIQELSSNSLKRHSVNKLKKLFDFLGIRSEAHFHFISIKIYNADLRIESLNFIHVYSQGFELEINWSVEEKDDIVMTYKSSLGRVNIVFYGKVSVDVNDCITTIRIEPKSPVYIFPSIQKIKLTRFS